MCVYIYIYIYIRSTTTSWARPPARPRQTTGSPVPRPAMPVYVIHDRYELCMSTDRGSIWTCVSFIGTRTKFVPVAYHKRTCGESPPRLLWARPPGRRRPTTGSPVPPPSGDKSHVFIT